jgi:molecular chaperone DnaK
MITGIDLGTTFSLISALQKDGTPTLLPDNTFRDLFSTPSAIHINDNNAVVGYMVDTLVEENPNLKVVRFFKRQFGTGEYVYYDQNGNGWLAETLGALILKKLKFDAENHTGLSLEQTVITVPSHFDDVQRKAVINAAAMADIPLLGLVEEPVAAALHYGIQSGESDKVMVVYDLGGGTFDATVLSMDESGVYVLAKDGLTELGGKEFDEAIAEMILHQFQKTHGAPLPMNSLTMLQLRRISEEIKIELSIPTKTYLTKTILIGNQALGINIYRRDFETAIRSMIEQTIEVTMRCIDGAGLKESDVDALMLVGGSSMIPYIKERLSKLFSVGADKLFFHEPMKAVAFGASIHAAQLSGDAASFNIPPEFRGVTGYNIGIQTINPRTGQTEFDCLIRKNLPLPARAKRTYFTTSAQQTKIRLQVVQYDETLSTIKQIGELVIGPIPNPNVNYPVEVVLENANDGTVKVSAFDPETGVELEQSFGVNSADRNSILLQQKNLVNSIYINNL